MIAPQPTAPARPENDPIPLPAPGRTGESPSLVACPDCDLLNRLDGPAAAALARANTAREIYERLRAAGRDDLVTAVCERARVQAEVWSGLPVTVYLVTAEEGVVCSVTD